MANISSCSLACKAVDHYAVDQGNFKDHFLKILKIDRFRILGMTNLSDWTTIKKMMGLVFLLQLLKSSVGNNDLFKHGKDKSIAGTSS